MHSLTIPVSGPSVILDLQDGVLVGIRYPAPAPADDGATLSQLRDDVRTLTQKVQTMSDTQNKSADKLSAGIDALEQRGKAHDELLAHLQSDLAAAKLAHSDDPALTAKLDAMLERINAVDADKPADVPNVAPAAIAGSQAIAAAPAVVGTDAAPVLTGTAAPADPAVDPFTGQTVPAALN